MVITKVWIGSSSRISELEELIGEALRMIIAKILYADSTDLSKLEAAEKLLNEILRLDYFNDEIDIKTLRRYVREDIMNLNEEIVYYKHQLKKLKEYIVQTFDTKYVTGSDSFSDPPEIREIREIVRRSIEETEMKIIECKRELGTRLYDKKVLTTLLKLTKSGRAIKKIMR